MTQTPTKNNIDNTSYVWGLNDYDVSQSIMKTNRVVYCKCTDELQLLQLFLNHSFIYLPPNNFVLFLLCRKHFS